MIPTDGRREFEALLEFLRHDRSFDFTGYKRASLERRVQKRMMMVHEESYAGYLAYLIAEPGEFAQLLSTLLINVTRFFRDDLPWDKLAEGVLPDLLARHGPTAPVRVWSAGCSSGEEAYTVAMVLAEALGMDAYRDRVKIYATDVDDESLNRARAAAYVESQLLRVPDALRKKYFERTADSRFVVRSEIRRSVIFGNNDLVRDAPISRVDLLLCRNTLMYFNAATQEMILRRFHFALADGGVLMLGRAETILAQTSTFAAIDVKRRLFRKVTPDWERVDTRALGDDEHGLAQSTPPDTLWDAAFDVGGEAQLVLDRAGQLILANHRARSMFGLATSDIGRVLPDLELSRQPVDLCSAIEQCYDERRVISVRSVLWRPRHLADDRWLRFEISPLVNGTGRVMGVSVLIADVTDGSRLRRALKEATANLEMADGELQSTNEELETTNEELQSTVEELETTNEELQSTNEELETMNEELHSTNDELENVNDELRLRGDELHRLNDFLGAVFTSMRGGVVVLDRAMRVLVWNAQAEELWGIRSADVLARDFLGLDIGLPVAALAAAINGCLGGSREEQIARLPAVNRRGRAIEVSAACTPLLTVERLVCGVILTMEEVK